MTFCLWDHCWWYWFLWLTGVLLNYLYLELCMSIVLFALSLAFRRLLIFLANKY